jgi:UDP-N-acetylmuramate dehydrogenase
MFMSEPRQFGGLRGTWHRELPMREQVSWRAGGTARRAYRPADLDDLLACLQGLPADEPLLFVGLGSNLLVRDGGFNGTALLLHAALRGLRMDGERIYAEAGVASPKLARFAARHGRTGAEFLAGIPGTVGGALAMNAGCYGGETWSFVDRVLAVTRRGEQIECGPADFEIGYRHVVARSGGVFAEPPAAFLAAWFAFPQGDGDAARARIAELLEKRRSTQPLELPNAGSVFRNPPGDFAARLIEAAGLKGLRKGGAQVSVRHANFIVNAEGRATAADIEALIEAVRNTVADRFGVELQTEVRIVGERA